MAKGKEYLGFETLGADIKEARKALGLSRKALAEKVNIDPRYLANIENSGNLPSVPVLYELARICKLPIERYFNPEEAEPEGSEQRQRVGHKLKLCPEQYLPIIEGAIDGAIKIEE
ncbi:helix-turn-helix transcriptional regulator [Clostridioides difficile]|uniref:helix-turn-helix transcriptional regulator n=1 Tax=Clostridioides difficile TaxID=1496 RepID=UPI0010352ADA|nr:helix-turn-helix transcriptional regulator [Clostridioides difficile]